jgi:acyl carrier protein
MEFKIRNIISTVFEIPVTALPPEFNQEDIEKWDSLGHLRLIVELEKEFTVQFEPEEIAEMNSYDRIMKVVSSKIQ